MSHARMVVGSLLLGIFIAAPIVVAEEQGRLAEGRSLEQNGFPTDLYRW